MENITAMSSFKWAHSQSTRLVRRLHFHFTQPKRLNNYNQNLITSITVLSIFHISHINNTNNTHFGQHIHIHIDRDRRRRSKQNTEPAHVRNNSLP